MSIGLDLSPGHQCYGCQKQIADYEEHIHLSLDEWGATVGLEPVGFEVMIALCSDCTRPGGPFLAESHAVPLSVRPTGEGERMSAAIVQVGSPCRSCGDTRRPDTDCSRCGGFGVVGHDEPHDCPTCGCSGTCWPPVCQGCGKYRSMKGWLAPSRPSGNEER